MNKCIVALFAAGLAISGLAESIKLPPPDMDGGLTVMQALKARHSERQFSEAALSLQELSGVLWAANGFNRPDKRTNATGLNKQTIMLFVCMKSGAYRYDAKANELVKVSDADLRQAVAGRQAFAATAPVSVVIAADTSDPIYKRDRGILSCYDAGIVSGNIYLYCAAHNLATVCRRSMDLDQLKKGLGLSDDIMLHLNHPIGHLADASAFAVTDIRAAPASVPKMVAHRGAGDLTMPEASLPAYSNALATACAIVKLDMRCTKDGVIVMGHDPTLKRNMGWDVEISSLDYAEILEKGRFLENGKPGNYRIVRLDEALDIVKAAPELWLDFKNFSPEMAEKVMKEVEKAGIDRSHLMVATFSKGALAYFRDHYPEIRRVGHFNIKKDRYANNDEMRKAVMLFKDEYGLYGLNMPVDQRKTSLEDIAFLKGKGIWVSLWYIQNEKDAAYYLPASPDAFVTDHVSAVRQALGK